MDPKLPEARAGSACAMSRKPSRRIRQIDTTLNFFPIANPSQAKNANKPVNGRAGFNPALPEEKEV